MSYAMSAALQSAVYAALREDGALAALVGDRVFDAAPPGEPPELYVALGAEEARARGDSSGGVTEHRLAIGVSGTVAGFAALKAAAGAVSDRLDGGDLALSRGRLVSMRFERARARRISGNRGRRIDLWFRAVVEDS
ncbi:DUF3168 domain-containing protein [Mangrovicoccus algicola]|uniref:DUF3168 domain-containing protein n=1 Tax=Mangrovicoccus algicola TaxID=2771008 RepID=A0A8J6YXN6_9RHOB|nr:DUF3168 domain-containing protein [Mangrovicoccus algicola]MBE3639737.1 DUF3168 domain-containing protein [Mangrovicoccus algicola]